MPEKNTRHSNAHPLGGFASSPIETALKYEEGVNDILENGPNPKTRLFTAEEVSIAIEFFSQKKVPVEDVVLWGRGINPYDNKNTVKVVCLEGPTNGPGYEIVKAYALSGYFNGMYEKGDFAYVNWGGDKWKFGLE